MNKVALGIITKGNQVLLVKRKKNDGIVWAFPGGKVESGETDRDAVVREVNEETNIVCEANKIIGTRTHPMTNDFVYYWLCEILSGSIKVVNINEIDQVTWIEKERALNLLGEDTFEPVKLLLK